MAGWVIDASYRPVAQAHVRVAGIGNTTTDENGHYAMAVTWGQDRRVVVIEAPGYVTASSVVQPSHPAQLVRLNVTLTRQPPDPWTDTSVHNGHIACGIIAQLGHSHGGGTPEDDQHVACPILTGEGEQWITYVPERDADDMLIEVFWTPQSRMAEYLTVILYDDQGELVQFEEGTSPLRLEVGQIHVQQRFQDGRHASIELRAGISDEDPPGELYVSMHVDQSFDVFATTAHGMRLPAGWTIQG